MTSRKRLLTVLEGGLPDRCPATVHQWQKYHLEHFMNITDELEAFQKTGLDAVIYAWDCFLPSSSPQWIVDQKVNPRSEMTIPNRTPSTF